MHKLHVVIKTRSSFHISKLKKVSFLHAFRLELSNTVNIAFLLHEEYTFITYNYN